MFKKSAASILILLFAGVASAAPIVQSQSIAPTNTNYSTSLSFDQFDNQGGTLALDSVTISVSGVIDGDIEVESLDAAAGPITTTLDAMLTLSGNGLGNLLSLTLPTITNTFMAGAFDGLIDFTGSSGVAYVGLGDTVFADSSFTDAATLAFFTGNGTQDFTFDALASSFATGPGNLFSHFNVVAGGTITVTYNSVAVAVASVSAPNVAIIFSLGLAGLIGFKRSKS